MQHNLTLFYTVVDNKTQRTVLMFLAITPGQQTHSPATLQFDFFNLSPKVTICCSWSRTRDMSAGDSRIQRTDDASCEQTWTDGSYADSQPLHSLLWQEAPVLIQTLLESLPLLVRVTRKEVLLSSDRDLVTPGPGCKQLRRAGIKRKTSWSINTWLC